MSTFKDWETYKRLKDRGDTNSVVDVLKNKNTGDLIVRKIIYGIEQPLYQAVFTREVCGTGQGAGGNMVFPVSGAGESVCPFFPGTNRTGSGSVHSAGDHKIAAKYGTNFPGELFTADQSQGHPY